MVSDALDLTAESQFLSIAKEENEPDDNANVPVDTIEENVVGDLEIVGDGRETPKDTDTVNTGEDGPADDVSVTGENSGTKIDTTSASISQVANNDTNWPLTSKPCSPVDDAVEVPCAEMTIVESDGGGDGGGDGASDDMIDAGAAPITLRETIEAILGMTTPLGQCLGDIDVSALNEERAYWSNEVAVETRQFDEHHRLAPLIKRSEDLDAEIALKEEEIEAVLERIGGEVGKN